ncbi:hypothetical protein [Pseudonocardia broussonetiae]|uniref:Uncharacterized protein n=1 Tax=Pseudonocardia broussonetiae TaxID=2736640 RepID=A0A6M6JFF2_9PSEU|nr:hypothetical protein [Pseudonocardia broussonetiae]QJY46674.1 hypothetical protein HOP40_13295 [Pseudonocardia broussonetiae]
MTHQDQDRYTAAMHAMQSGVAADQSGGSEDGTPKHLRVGVNSALVSVAGIGRLLIDKGVITQDEYEAAVADAMENEVRLYERRLSERLGSTVTLS